MDYACMKLRLQIIGFGNTYLENHAELLKILLKALLGDKTNSSTKLDLLILIEEEATNLLADEDSIELVITAFRSLQKLLHSTENFALLHGQSLISSTSVLLNVFLKEGGRKIGQHLLLHIEALLSLVCQTNNPKNVYQRSVAAMCLMEIELCMQGILKRCLDMIYSATVFETSIAHQQYLELLSVLMCNSQELFPLTSDTLHFHIPESLSGAAAAAARPAPGMSISELEQMIAFTLGQLPLLSTCASVHVAGRMGAMLLALGDAPLSLASVHMIQPVLQQYLSSHCLSAFQLVLSLERQFGSSEHFQDDLYRQNILDHLICCSSLPAMPVASRLIFLSWLESFLSSHKDRAAKITTKQLVSTHATDGTHTQLKKIKVMTLIPSGCSDSVQMQYLAPLQKQVKSGKASVKVKSTLLKVLYCMSKDIEGKYPATETIHKSLVDATVQDITFAPFLLNFIHKSGESELEIEILSMLMPELLKPTNKTNTSLADLECTLEILKHAVATQNVTISRPKEMLTHVTVCLEEMDMEVSASTGHCLLSLCPKIMKLFDAREFLQEMEKVLRTLIAKCAEEDVQNRAQSYITLLSCLSDLKVKEVLKAQKRAQLMVTEGMFHKPDALIFLQSPLLTLEKQSHDYLKTTLPADTETIPEFPLCALEIYQQHIANEASMKAIYIPCIVTIVGHIEKDLNLIQAAAIFITPCSPFGIFEAVLVGNITQKLKCTNAKELTTSIKYIPMQPYPLTMTLRAEFSMNGLYQSCPMEPVRIELVDLFQPLPVPDEFLDSAHQWRKGVFSQLWDTLERGDAATQCFGTAVIHMPISHVRYKLKHQLKPMVLQQDMHKVEIGIYLAPSSHILLKVVLGEDASSVKIVTDNVFLLAHTNDYLSQW